MQGMFYRPLNWLSHNLLRLFSICQIGLNKFFWHNLFVHYHSVVFFHIASDDQRHAKCMATSAFIRLKVFAFRQCTHRDTHTGNMNWIKLSHYAQMTAATDDLTVTNAIINSFSSIHVYSNWVHPTKSSCTHSTHMEYKKKIFY